MAPSHGHPWPQVQVVSQRFPKTTPLVFRGPGAGAEFTASGLLVGGRWHQSRKNRDFFRIRSEWFVKNAEICQVYQVLFFYFWHGHSCCQCQTVLWIRHRWGILGSPWSGITSSSVPIARVDKTSTCNGDDVYHGNWDRHFPGVCGQLYGIDGVLTFLARTILNLWIITIGDLMMVNPQE